MKKLLFLFLHFGGIQAGFAQDSGSDIPKKCSVSCRNCTNGSIFQRPFVSHEFKVKKGEEPNYQGILLGVDGLPLDEQNKVWLPYLVMQQNEPCDEIGTMYTARYMAYFWPDTPEYQSLDKRHQGVVDVLFKIAKKGTYNSEGAELSSHVMPQAKCIAEVLRAQKGL